MDLLTQAQNSLNEKLECKALRPVEMVEGVQEIFFICQYRFVADTQHAADMETIQQLSKTIINEAFSDIGIQPRNASPVIVRYVAGLLTERFGFSADQDLMAFQRQALNQLFKKPIQYIIGHERAPMGMGSHI